MTTFIDNIISTEQGRWELNQERAILDLTELICEIMARTGVTRAELARRLGKTKGFITQLLDGRANMTIRTISDIFSALGCAIHFQEKFDGDKGGGIQRMDINDPWRDALLWQITFDDE